MSIQNIYKIFSDNYSKLTNENKIKETYKIIHIDWLNPILIKSTMITDDYFKKSQQKKEMVDDMLNYYLNHTDIEIYKKTDYLCNEEEQICICNTHAEDFRKIFDGNNYKKGNKYISWFNVKYKYKFTNFRFE